MPTSRRSPAVPIRVLIAEDNTDIREMYAEYLEFAGGFEVVTAADGITAVEKTVDHRPDVLVLDITMPGLDGLWVAKAVKADARMKRARIIAVTGHAFKGSADEARRAGVDVYLTKPCLPEDLAAEIRRQAAHR